MESPFPTPRSLVHTFRRFGPFGPVYEVLAIHQELDGGDALLRVRLPETQEEVDIRYSQAILDPEAG